MDDMPPVKVIDEENGDTLRLTEEVIKKIRIMNRMNLQLLPIVGMFFFFIVS